MNRLKLFVFPSFILLLLVSTIPCATGAPMEVECVLTHDVVVKDAHTKLPLAALKRGDRIYSGSPQWPWARPFIVLKGTFKELDDLNENMIDCNGHERDARYPIVFVNNEVKNESEQLTKEFGIESWYLLGRDPLLRNNCYGVIALSDEVVSYYREKGFSLNNICLVLASGQIRFDPETGMRLPTYVIVDQTQEDGKIDAAVSDEYLFYAPPCYARGAVRLEATFATMNPTGCVVRYHPWSGRKLSETEVKFFTRVSEIWAGGVKGDVLEDSQNLANDASRRATAAKIEAIKNQATSR